MNTNDLKILDTIVPESFFERGIFKGLDSTVFNFLRDTPRHLISDSMWSEALLRLSKYLIEFERSRVHFDTLSMQALLGSAPSNKMELNKLVSKKLKANSLFNTHEKKIGAIFCNDTKIKLTFTKQLTNKRHLYVLNKLGKMRNIGGSNTSWEFEEDLFEVLNFLMPEITKEFSILGLDEYNKYTVSYFQNHEPRKLTDCITSQECPNTVVIDASISEYKILCGEKIIQQAKTLLRPICILEENGLFTVPSIYAFSVKTFAKIFSDIAFCTHAYNEIIDFHCLNIAEPFYKSVDRGAAPVENFLTITPQLTHVTFEYTHWSKSKLISKKLHKLNCKSTKLKHKTTIECKDLSTLHEIRKIAIDTDTICFSSLGNGSKAFSQARRYLKSIAENPKSSVEYLGGRRFAITNFSSGTTKEHDFMTEESTISFLDYIKDHTPTVDDMTAARIMDMLNDGDLAAYRIETNNGRTYKISSTTIQTHNAFDFLPPHCVRVKDELSVEVNILTASQGIKLRDYINTYGFFSKDNKKKILAKLNKQIDEFLNRLDKSHTMQGTIEIPDFNGNDRLEPEQRGAVEFILDTPNRKTLIADEPGFGKTWEAYAAIITESAFPCLVIVPSIGKLSWQIEANNLVKNRSSIALGELPIHKRDEEREAIAKTDIVIVNYSMLGEFIKELEAVKFESMIIDESHYIKHEDSQRSQHTHNLKKVINPRIILPLSGSYWENRPAEAWSTIKLLDKQALFGGEQAFKERYCKDPIKKNYSGANFLEEFNEICRSHFMIRRQKNTGGKTKWRQSYVPVSKNTVNLAEYNKLEKDMALYILELAEIEADKQVTENPELEGEKHKLVREFFKKEWIDSKSKAEWLTKRTLLRNILAQAKIPAAIDFINSYVQQDEKLVVFAHHRGVQNRLYQHFNEAGVKVEKITATMNSKQRKEAELNFREGQSTLIICSIGAASENVNFASASHVFFVEGLLKPLTQARKRIDRHPQKSSILNAWYLRVPETIDDWVYDLSEQKYINFTKGSGDKVIEEISPFKFTEYTEQLVNRYQNS